MRILLRQVHIIDPASPFHQQQTDLFIEHGHIRAIGKNLVMEADQVVEQPDLAVSPGWLDPFSHFCDPGEEFKETLQTGAASAAAGGYTDVMVLPNTQPVVHHKASVEYIVARSATLPVRLHPIGAITRNAEGKELAEMYDMQASGAVAFSDGKNPVQSSGLLLKALQYVLAIEKVIIQLPDDRSINGSGLMHEGIMSTRLGLPGKPAIAEELQVVRDIELCKYTNSRLHLTGISSAGSVELVRKAKAEGWPVTCSVTPHHLCFIDEDLSGYDTNLKVLPPLRTAADRDALRAAVADGTVDCIATHHLPEDTDGKVAEFEYARPGIIGLETAFGVVRSCMPELALERLVELFAGAPRRIFGLQLPAIDVDVPARLTLFQPGTDWVPQAYRSRSSNTPFTGRKLKGRPLGIITEDKLFLNA